jgi:hypothetical protein
MSKKRLYGVILLGFFIGLMSVAASAQTRRILRRETASEDLRLLRPTGVTMVSPTLNAINIRPGDYVIARLGNEITVEQLPEGKRRFTLPFRLYGVNQNGTTLNLDVVVEDEGGMRFADEANRFEGILHIGVVDRDNPTSTQQTLPAALNLLVINEQGGIRPDGDLQINHTNLPFEEVIAFSVDPRDPFNIKIRSSFSETPVMFGMTINRPQLALTISPPAIKGFGLEAAEIIVRVQGLSQPEGKNVILAATRGGLEDASLEFDRNGTASTKIRSSGVGEAVITASMGGADGVSARLMFVKPWAFFLIAIVGGFVGSLIFLLQDKVTSGKKIVGRIFLGILIAIIVAVGFAVGVNLTGVEPKAKVGEAVIFFLAVIGSWLGKLVLPQKS